jgi:geranyl-CoA carboxylase beta subunit
MPLFESRLNTQTAEYGRNRSDMLALITQMRQLETRAQQASARARARFDKRGQILPRERLARLLDPGEDRHAA